MNKIKFIIFDIDGTLTDGKIYITDQGEFMKAFDIKDGYAIFHLQKYGITPIVITGRTSKIVEKRCAELKIRMLYQGVNDKKSLLAKIVENIREKDASISLENFAYMGDDIPDLECMQMCGVTGCPENAIDEIKEICDFISTKKGGDGAAREFIEWIVKK